MTRVSIIDEKGKALLPSALTTAAELRAVAAQARGLIAECERLARLIEKDPKVAPAWQGGVPYMK